ncbi:MAG: ADP-ribosylglycohydrolase family protein [Dehalococcoidia bacterium]
MMIGIAQSLIQCKGFDGEHMAWQFMENFSKEPFRGYGPGPPRIFRMIKDGVPWGEASERIYRGGSYGNGGAMRIAPVGLLYHDDAQALRSVSSVILTPLRRL